MTAVTSAGTRTARPAAISAAALVRRVEELAALTEAVERPPSVAVLSGEAGIGKSRLVAELRARQQAAGRLVVVGACRQVRDPFPLFPVIEAVRQLRSPLRSAQLSPVAGAARKLLPELSDLLPPAPEPIGDRRAEQHLVFRALVEILAAAGETVLVLEDLHWADVHTPDFLRYLLADPPTGLSLVLTYREEEVAAAVRALSARLPASAYQVRVPLAPLDPAGAGELAAAILGTSRVSDEFAGYLCERASGLPFAVEELLALLRAQGTMIYRDGTWARRALDRLDVPVRIRDQVLARVSHLSADARAVLAAAAVLHVPVPLGVLTATGELPAHQVQPAVEESIASGVLSESSGRVGFRHVLAAEAVYESISGVRRQLLHARAAEALRTLDPPPLGEIAQHLRHAGQVEAWVDAAEGAAEQAIGLGHHGQAMQVLEEVLRHAPLTDEQAGQIAVRLGHIVAPAATGGAAQVTALLSSVLDRQLAAPVRGELSLVTALAMDHDRSDVARQRQLCEIAVEHLDPARADLRAWAMACLGIPIDGDVPLTEYRRWQRRAVAELAAIDDPRKRQQLLGKLAMVQVTVGDPQWRELLAELDGTAALVSRQERPDWQAAWSYYGVAVAACYAGHHEQSAQLLAQAASYPRSWEHPFRGAVLRSAQVLIDYCQGDWKGLRRRADQLVDQLVDFAPARAEAQLVAGCLRMAQGDLVGARAALASLPGADTDIAGNGGVCAAALIRLALAEGDPAAAATLTRQLLVAARRQGIWAPLSRSLPVMAEALLAAGDLVAAGQLVAEADVNLQPLDVPFAATALRHTNGLILAARHRWALAATDLLAAAEGHERLRAPYEAAQARERASVCQFEAGDPAASDTLRQALGTYQSLAARGDVDRAGELGRRFGVVSSNRHRGGRRGYGAALSPREHEVARLVATGQTNQEIASQLYLSVSTVEKHVASVLRKLDARSRRQVRERIAGPPSQ